MAADTYRETAADKHRTDIGGSSAAPRRHYLMIGVRTMLR